MTTINAFHPMYVHTHMPDFVREFRRTSGAITEGKKAAAKPRKTRQSAGQSGKAPLSDFPKTQSSRIDLTLRQYNTYRKAGAK